MTIEELNIFAQEKGNEIYGFCYYLSGNKLLAEELYQDTFLKATEKHKKIQANREAKAYVIGISIRIWKNKLRKSSNRRRIIPFDYYVDKNQVSSNILSPLDEVINNDKKTLILTAVNSLRPNQKLTIIMFYYQNLSIEEIAKILKLPTGTVKSRLHTGRQQIKLYLEEHHYEK